MKKQLTTLFILINLTLGVLNFVNIAFLPIVGATYVEGPITRDTIWTLVDSPFVVSNDIVIYSNATLTIEPGVEVRFGGAFSLNVSGVLYANGTDKMISFTSNKEQPNAGDWNAIIFNGATRSTLVNCFISYAEIGILVVNGDVEIINCTVTSSQNGITAFDGELRVLNSTISHCSQDGINIIESESIIENSIIMENLQSGISVTGNRQVTIQDNTVMANGNGIRITGSETSNLNIRQNKITANLESGIRIDADNHTNIVILNNIISSNIGIGIYVLTQVSTHITNNSISYNEVGIFYENGNHSASFNDIYGNVIMGMDVADSATVVAERNYWGDPSGPYHESLNPDGKGDHVGGGDEAKIDFIPFLTKPIGIINIRPTAILLADKILVQPNADVMFFGTNSLDVDGRIDWYRFSFGDGQNSGWTALSTFTHKYSSIGTYQASLIVMDDYGTASNSVFLTMNISVLSPLQISISLSSSLVHEGDSVSITAYVNNGTVALANATVSLFSVKGGSFTESTGLTNASGYFTTTFTAPNVMKLTHVRIFARASSVGYADGSDHAYLEVSPFLHVEIDVVPNTIKSEGTAQVSVYVTSDGELVANASISLSSTAGSLSSETGFTDRNGAFSVIFTAPLTTTSLDIAITATAQKSGFMNGMDQTMIRVEPKIPVVQLTAQPNATISEEKIDVIVYVEYETVQLEAANVTIMAEDGIFSATSVLTDSYGNARFIFTAPPVSVSSNITITAQATKTGYATGQGQLVITVDPKTFDIQISELVIRSGESSTVSVKVKCNEDGKVVSGANVTILSNAGSFSTATGITDALGACTFLFNAPETTAQIFVVVTANVSKDGYTNGVNQTLITVTPSAIPSAEGGWSIVTILLILIPVIIAVIIVILIKTKVIRVTMGEEEEE